MVLIQLKYRLGRRVLRSTCNEWIHMCYMGFLMEFRLRSLRSNTACFSMIWFGVGLN